MRIPACARSMPAILEGFMNVRLLALPTLALVSLTGCASLDEMASNAEMRSNCHTSDGQFVGAPGCTITLSSSRTAVTTTTTVETTTTPPPAPEDVEP